MDRDNDIRLIAYHIWEEEGCPDGKDCEHWTRAEMIWEANKPGKTPVAAAHKAAGATAKATTKKAVSSAKKSSRK
jgi:hypothetical protein